MPTASSPTRTRSLIRFGRRVAAPTVALWLAAVPLAAGVEGPYPAPPIWPGDAHKTLPGQDVFLTQDGHEIIVLAPAPDGTKKIVRIRLWNDLAPSVSEGIESLDHGLLRYAFTITNGPQAKDSIRTWDLVVPATGDVVHATLPVRTPENWRAGGVTPGGVIARQEALGSEELGRHLRWFPPEDETRRIAPGESLSGVAVDSAYLPGFTTAWFSSLHWPQQEFDDNWPAPIQEQLNFFNDPKYREKMLLVIGPMLAPGSSDPPIVANFQAGIRELIKAGRLNPSSPFVRALSEALNGPPGHWRSHELSAAPADATERLLARAAALSLGMRFASSRP